MNAASANLEWTAPRAAIQRLIREHRDVDLLLLMVESYFAALNAGEDVDDALLLDAMRYMTDFADGFHHAKERLAVDAVAQRSTAIAAARAELEAQYERIGEAGPWLCGALELALRDEPIPKRRLIRTGLSYTAEVRRNMALEEKVVFPALAEVLDAGAWRLLDAKISPQRDPLFGETIHQRYALRFRELVARFGCEDEARYE